MPEMQLFAVTAAGAHPLPVPATAQDFLDLYAGLALGVYSVLRTFDHNKFLYLDHHLARTVASMQMLGWDYQLDEPLLRQTLHTICTAYPAPEMRARIDVLAEPIVHEGGSSRLLIALQPFAPLPESAYTQGVTVNFAEGLSRKNPRIKTANFAAVRKKYANSNAHNFEQLLVNDQGEILEGVSSNFYGVQQGVLRTAGAGVLEGITRKIILGLADKRNIPVQLTAIHVDEIASLSEAAISSSSRGWLPVVAIAGHPVGNGQPGPISQQMIEAYNAFVQREAKTALE